MKRALVTGATGFVGKVLCARMLSDGWQVKGVVRSLEKGSELPDGVEAVLIESIDSTTNWSRQFNEIDVVVHLAARVHVMKDKAKNPLSSFRDVNVDGAIRLARMAGRAGVKRFVFLSSVKVNGEATSTPYSEVNKPDPIDSYGTSKWEAEEALNRIAIENGLDVVIIRPPLVYGPGVKANFLRLLKWTKLGLPLPLGNLDNHRSMIYVGNLVDAIMASIENPKAAGETFLVSDGEDVSTPQLIRMISSAMGKKSRLLPVPPAFLNVLGKITGKSAEIKRLTASLQVDSGKIRKMLGWEPPFTVEDGIKETVYWYLDQGK